MRTTVVLGGGGTVGVAWQTGLIIGLGEAGVDLAGTAEIVGTSAGSLVGALLASGRDMTGALAMLKAVGERLDAGNLAAGSDGFQDASRRAASATDPRPTLREIGSAARKAPVTLTEDDYLGLFGVLDGETWPPGFRCTAVDTDTGELVVWGEHSRVPLLHAVAASCVVPMLFPPVTIGGVRYMDGGIVSRLNVSAAPRSDVLVVVSCRPLDGAEATEVDRQRGSTRVVTVEPDFGDLGTPARMMDPAATALAFPVGRRQAEHAAAAIRAARNGLMWRR
ncbi:patatin-like phospholipase family protein [Catenuloplanes sp. NPDC051500]|uniref:patatin-like phospholipase family protein n=1 Tax=Catenuloplanes sp. NPDC051500 TaxID=3363959 RepID=UPI0037B2B3CD